MKYRPWCSRATTRALPKYLKPRRRFTAAEIYRRHGCSEEFLYDWQLLVDEVKAYQKENGARVKLPRLLPSEAETVRDEMARREAAG